MKTVIPFVVTLSVLPVVAFAQVSTSTSPVGLDEVVGTIPAIIAAFKSGGIWAGIAAIFGTLAALLNFGPLKKKLAESPVDWIRPLIMLLGVGLTAALSASSLGADALSAVISGVIAGLGSGFVQKLIQDIRDK
jgi:hypothetical protein